MSAPRLVFDTSAVIGLVERADSRLRTLLVEHGRPIVRSLAVHGELVHGVEASDLSNRGARRRTLDRYERLSAWPNDELELDELTALYGEVSATSSEPKLSAGANDRWVITDCLALSADLVTADIRQGELAHAAANRLGRTLGVHSIH